MKYNNVIFLGLCLGLTTYSALSADSVIKGTRTEQYFALLRSFEVNSEVRQSRTGERFGNLYP
ncbi:type 1 fimbrial protein [Escherichia coli]|nr:type 1 fimbrial protein [Escherichia coli]